MVEADFPARFNFIKHDKICSIRLHRAEVRGCLASTLRNGGNLCVGDDEAGRGGVVGPMIYGMYIAQENDTADLNDVRHADGKS